MKLSLRVLSTASLIAVSCLTVAQGRAAVQTGSFSFDAQTVHYQFFTGKDPAFFQSFATGATLTNFETVNRVTPFNATSYDNKVVLPVNFVPPKVAVNGIFYSGGGQTPGNPANPAGTPFNTVLVNLDGIQGAHSGTHVLAPSDFEGTEAKFTGGFFSFGVQTANGQSANALSRIGWWTNPLMSAAATTPNIHLLDNTGVDHGNFLVDTLGITTKVQPGDFFAIAFDKPILQEAEFVVVDHATIDDVVYARDNSVAFVPEPSSWLLLASGMGLLMVLARRKH